MTKILKLFDEVRDIYPEPYQYILDANRSRLTWQIENVVKRVKPGGTLLDIGAGIVPFMLICQKLGFKTVIVDDLEDNTYGAQHTKAVLKLFKKEGVKIIQGDTFTDTANAIYEYNFDLVTSHDSMEHWHNSPKSMLHRLWKNMNKDGILWIGVPNCVNLRKRITVPFGKGKWSAMKDWYEEPVFRGHVREPDVGDLRYIANDLGARRVEIVGKNWLGYRHPSKFVRTITPFIDPFMQFKPSLCSDLNLFATK